MEDELKNLSLKDVEKKVSNFKLEKKKKASKTDNLEFEIIEEFGQLSDSLNAPLFSYVDWGDCKRFDIRKWNKDRTVPYKGISFTKDEMEKLQSLPDSFPYFSNVREEYSSSSVTAKIYENIAVLSEKNNGKSIWRKEINWVDWGYGVKIDIRTWDSNYQKCGKGICLSQKEYVELLRLIKKMDFATY